MAVTKENLKDVISYHKPDDDGLAAIQEIRNATEGLIATILLNTPSCADQTAAVRKVREAMMTANAAVALNGLV